MIPVFIYFHVFPFLAHMSNIPELRFPSRFLVLIFLFNVSYFDDNRAERAKTKSSLDQNPGYGGVK